MKLRSSLAWGGAWIGVACAGLLVWRAPAGPGHRPEGRSRPVAVVEAATGPTSAEPVELQSLPDTVETPAQLRSFVHACREADRADRERLLVLARSEDPLVAGNAVRALGRLGLADAALLDPLLKDERPRVRHEAIQALGKGGHADAVERLSAVLATDDATARALAIRSLGELDDERARSVLEALADSDDLTGVERVFVRTALGGKHEEPVRQASASRRRVGTR